MPKSSKAEISRRCTGCGACISKCPQRAIEFFTVEYVKKARVIEELCDGCEVCIPHCQFKAIKMNLKD
ncbi:MAG: 4Fe-4S binding protein [Deferribacterales bacterium]